MEANYNYNCAVIVSSCDAYEDAWMPFFTLFFRYWPDCPFPVYLITETKTYSGPRVVTLNYPDQSWATRTKKTLDRVKETYIIWLLEDLFFEAKTDTNYIVELISYAKTHHAATIRLEPNPPPDENYLNNLNLGLVSKKAEYRTSLISGIWNKDIFSSLIKPGESPWQMEVEGTNRSRSLDFQFFCVKSRALHWLNVGAIRSGKWTHEAVELCKREGITLNTRRLGIHRKRQFQMWGNKFRKGKFAHVVRQIPVAGWILSKLFYRVIK